MVSQSCVLINSDITNTPTAKFDNSNLKSKGMDCTGAEFLKLNLFHCLVDTNDVRWEVLDGMSFLLSCCVDAVDLVVLLTF